jgi:hypothetical protein
MFRKNLEMEKCPYLDVDLDDFNDRLVARDVRIQSFELV